MRLAAQMRGGFYPAPERAVAHAASFLCPPRSVPFTCLDPCAGEGAAIQQLSDLLGCQPPLTFAIELDDGRADKLRSALPQSQILAPASIFGCRVSCNSFSCIWLNPPFDFAYGGHRVEDRFLQTATNWLMPEGVMALVCPEDVVDEYSDARRHFMTYYENCTVEPFPASDRPFNEVIVFGQKRARPVVDKLARWESVQAPTGFIYHIPPGAGPKVFHKIEPTEPELQQMLARSPLRSHLSATPEMPLPSPPLALGIGHVALLLASGHLDGIVRVEGKPPHVVRGTSRKRSFVADETETFNPDNSVTTKTTISERVELVVRTVDLTGKIRTFGDNETGEQ